MQAVEATTHMPSSLWDCLAGGNSAVVTIAPVMHTAGLAVAVIGLRNMLNSGGAIQACELTSATVESAGARSKQSSDSQPGCQLQLVVKGHGTLLLYSSQPPSAVMAGDQQALYTHDTDSGELNITVQGEDLEQDIVVNW